MIVIENLSKSYGKHEVLRNINASFEKGKVYGIVGENGAGKTTLFRSIAGLQSYSGHIRCELGVLRNHLGFLPTHQSFLSKITGREYLTLFCHAKHVPISNFDEKNSFDLPLDQYATTYSTGMQKKLAIMAILLQKNDIYILDEPYNGVDIHSNIIITAIIQKLKAMGKTILISSHIFSTLQETCDEIHLLKDGQFAKIVQPKDFKQLEEEMKHFVINDSVDNLLGE